MTSALKTETDAPTRVRWMLIGWMFVVGAIAYLDRVNISIAGRIIADEFHRIGRCAMSAAATTICSVAIALGVRVSAQRPVSCWPEEQACCTWRRVRFGL